MEATPCLCFEYDETFDPGVDPNNADITLGGKVQVAIDGACDDFRDLDLVPVLRSIRREEVTNQSCLYKTWMCACWASQTVGCLCARENSGETVTIVRPTMGECPLGTGKLTNPAAHEAGGVALQCAPNPCLACCSCSYGLCSGNGSAQDDGAADCCACCGDRGGYTCGLGPESAPSYSPPNPFGMGATSAAMGGSWGGGSSGCGGGSGGSCGGCSGGRSSGYCHPCVRQSCNF